MISEEEIRKDIEITKIEANAYKMISDGFYTLYKIPDNLFATFHFKEYEIYYARYKGATELVSELINELRDILEIKHAQ